MSNPMTLDLEALKKLAGRATEGPWTWDSGIVPPDGPERYSDIYAPDCDIIIAGFNELIAEGNANAAFIAASREAVPALIAEVERLREALEPFTDIDTEGCEDMPEETRVVIKIGQRVTDYTTRLIHFRRARAALSPTPPADKED